MLNLGCTHQIVTLHSSSGQSTTPFVLWRLYLYIGYIFYTDFSNLWCLCRHDSYSNQYPGQGAPPGGAYPNQQPGMYPQQQLVGKQLIE